MEFVGFGSEKWDFCVLQIQQLIRGAKNAVSLAQVCFNCSKVFLSLCFVESFGNCLIDIRYEAYNHGGIEK